MMIDIQAGLTAYLESKRKTYPCHVNRVSSLDDPCVRRLYYRRAAWDKAAPHPTSLLGVFETGNVLEPCIERIISEVGAAATPKWRIVGSQTPTNDAFLREYNVSGTIDGFLQVCEAREGCTYVPEPMPRVFAEWVTQGVIDVKTAHSNIYPRLNSYQDLAFYPWTRSYRGQLMLYAFAHNLEDCYILFVNKGNLFEMKLIHFQVDMDYLERLLQKAEAVNEAVALGEPPEKVNDRSACERCQWLSYCCPELEPTGNLKIVDNEELEVVLDRLGELSETAEEVNALEARRDSMLTKGQDLAVGDWLITWKQAANKVWRKTIRCMPS